MISPNTMKNVFPFTVTNTNVQRLRPCGPVGGRLPPLQWGVPHFGWYHLPPQVIHPTWRAAGSRPYDTFVTNTVYFTRLSLFCVSKNIKNMVHYRRGGNLPPATWQLQPVGVNGITPRYVIPTVVSRGIFPSGKFYLVLVLFCHVEDSSTPLTLRSE